MKLRLFAAAAVVFCLPLGALGLMVKRYPWPDGPVPIEMLGPLGDYFGGLLNPLVSYIGLTGVAISLYLSTRAAEQSANAMRADTHARKVARAQDLLDEFYSSSFLQHRIVVSRIRQRVLFGQVDVEFLTRGFIILRNDEQDGDPDAYYEGETVGSLNEHQHLSAYLGYVVRLAGAVEFEVADRKMVSTLLRSQYFWHAKLLNQMTECATARLEKDAAAPDRPGWIHAVRVLNDLFEYHHETPVH